MKDSTIHTANRLQRRNREIARLARKGYSVETIARRFDLSEWIVRQIVKVTK